jgi:GPH family glycoside/pentoside/hexuronide:cation symporter
VTHLFEGDLSAAGRAAHLRRAKLSVGFKAVYGSGQMVDGVTQIALGTFLFFYVTAVCGLSGTLTGLAVSIGLVVDAVADPLVGLLSDNCWSRWGRRHPFLLVSVLPTAITLGLVFSIPTQLSQQALFAYVTIVSIALRISHSAFNLPFVALGAELSDDFAERTRIVASRFLFNVIATFTCLTLGYVVFLGGANGLLNRASYAPFGWTCGVLVLVGGLICGLGTLGARQRLHPIDRRGGPIALGILRDLKDVFGSQSFRVLFFSALALFIAVGVSNTLTIHANKFFWRLPVRMIQAVGILPTVGFGMGALLNMGIARRIERLTAVIVGLVVLSATQGVWPLLRVLDALPPNGPILFAILIGNSIVSGAATGFIGVSQHSMFADASDEHEWLFGTRREGLIYAALNFSAKAAVALGSLIAGVALDVIRFPAGIATHGGAQISIAPETLRGLGLIYGPGAAVLTLLSAVVFAGYRLNKHELARIQLSLAERRTGPSG